MTNDYTVVYLVCGQDLSRKALAELANELFWEYIQGDAEAGALDMRFRTAMIGSDEYELAKVVIEVKQKLGVAEEVPL